LKKSNDLEKLFEEIDEITLSSIREEDMVFPDSTASPISDTIQPTSPLSPENNVAVMAKERRPSKTISKHKFHKFDVISGRGGISNNFDGNKHFRHLISLRREEYKSKKSNPEKLDVSTSVLVDIHNLGGRFLSKHKSTENEWHEIKKTDAIKKISQALRETRPLKWM
jgi:hypothetical protein